MTEIIVAIFGIVYIFCMLWIVMSEAVEDFVLNVNYRTMTKLATPDYD
jgi:hypothetical protein